MSKATRPMILRFGTPTLQKDMKRIHKMLIMAGYQKVDEKEDYDHYAHTVEQTLSAKLGLEKVLDKEGNELMERIELILSDADSHVNQTIYNALATVFPREFTET